MSDLEGGSAWYLAQVRPNQFHIAEHNLVRQAFSVFCPTQEETRRRGGRFVSETRPLFPGYLFVTFNPASSAWRTINSTYGVSSGRLMAVERLQSDGRARAWREAQPRA